MTTADEREHRRWRELLGAYALGALEPDEAVAVLAHLDACAPCRDELAGLQATAGALATAAPPGPVGASPPPWLGERVVSAVAASRTRRSRGRRVAVAVGGLAAAVLLVAVVVLGLVGGDGADDDGGAVPLAVSVAPPGVEVSAAVEVRPWGTTVHLEASGLRTGQVYAAWLEQADGTRVSAGTFRPGADRSIRCYLTAAITPGEATAFGVTADGETALLAEIS